MQFQVPQFIEVEDKIFGPLTFRQFIYIGGALGSSYIIWRILPLLLAAPIIAGILGVAGALAFFKFNGRPFIIALENGFFFLMRSKLYLWNNAPKNVKVEKAPQKPKIGTEVYVPKLSESRLHELAWSLDIKERIAAGVADESEREASRTDSGIVAPIRVAQQARV
ncbi:MAG: PrgI family protein [Patescibacteria group bacterium]|nr:PrgI family protein [Patescibacteria group bacterium]